MGKRLFCIDKYETMRYNCIKELNTVESINRRWVCDTFGF